MERSKKVSLKFPKRFLWGVTTSAHQLESGGDNQWNHWERQNAPSLSKRSEYQFGDLESWARVKAVAQESGSYIANSKLQTSEEYEEDFKLIDKLNLNSFRFSVEWSEIESSEGGWNAAAIDYYKGYIRALKRRDIEPVITLFHYTLPAWFAEMGGFEKRANVKYFVRFAEKLVDELGISVRYIITINEPDTYARQGYLSGEWPPGVSSKWRYWRVVSNLAYAHRQAAAAIRRLNRRYKISITKSSIYFYPGDDAWITVLSARIMQYLQDGCLLKKFVRHSDFIGVNYHSTNRVYGYRVHNPNQNLSDTGLDLQPRDIQYMLERLHRKYRLPLIVTENGLADGEDAYRRWWIQETLLGLQAAIDEGVQLDGYFHYSLLDGFEWDKGRWPQYGLFYVDHTTGKHKARKSAVWFARVMKSIRSRE